MEDEMPVTLEDLDQTVDKINALRDELFKLRPELRELYEQGEKHNGED